MSYEVLRYIFIGAAALSGLMLIVSVLLFIFLKIPSVIGDLTGATARKAIENIRSQNENSGDKIHKTSAVNRARGRLTDKISASGKIIRHETNSLDGAMATAKIATQKLMEKDDSNATTVLEAESGDGTALLGDETSVLVETSSNETTVLGAQDDQTAALVESEPEAFKIEYEITFIHTNEGIE